MTLIKNLGRHSQAYILVAKDDDQDTLFERKDRESQRITHHNTNPPYTKIKREREGTKA
jgi:hypothetical protein